MTKTYQRGFTIVELLIVIVVIAILASITIVVFSGVRSRAEAMSVTSDLTNNRKALLIYQAENGKFPKGARSTGIACGVAPGQVSSDGVYCPAVSNGAFFYFAAYKTTNDYSNFTITIGKGTTGYTINDAGTITSAPCSAIDGVPPQPGYSTVYSCPNDTIYSQ